MELGGSEREDRERYIKSNLNGRKVVADVHGKGRHLPCCAWGSAGKHHPAHHDNTIRSLPWRIIHLKTHTSLIWLLDVSIRTRLQFSKCGTDEHYQNTWEGYNPEAIDDPTDMPGQKHDTVIFALINPTADNSCD
jgi:hypothetical protein